ncbi:unnamed protein product, partial [Closterium sp. Naga37s-1]
SLPAERIPASVRCETGCGDDCGSEARCIARDGQNQCVCPGSQLYDDTQKQCREPPPPTCAQLPPCPTNSTCSDNDKPSQCLCNEGFTMKNKQCIPLTCEELECPTNSFCVEKEIPRKCRCYDGFKTKDNQCIRKPLAALPLPSHPLSSYPMLLFIAFAVHAVACVGEYASHMCRSQ